MRNKILLAFFMAVLCLAGMNFVLAQEPNEAAMANIEFPIAELGNCADKDACRAYCDITENMSVCLDYAENKSLLPAAEINVARKAVKRILAGDTPGNCKDKDSCEKFCRGNVESMRECVSFAEEVGGLSGQELERAKKVVKALEQGASLPGGCSDNQSCESFCAEPENIDSCLNFAEAAELMSADELAEAKKVAPLLKAGKTPGKCKTKKDCEDYCANDNNAIECVNFAEEAGFIGPEEAEIARKTGGKGPGGCKGKEACDEFCNKPENAEMCFNFAIDNGLVSEEEKQQMQEGAGKIKEGLSQVPPEARDTVEACLNSAMNGRLNDALSGGMVMTKNQGQQIGPCFESVMQDYGQKKMEEAMQGQVPAGVPVDMESLKGQLPTDRPPTEEEVESIKKKAQESAPKPPMPAQLPPGVSQEEIEGQLPADRPPTEEEIENIKKQYEANIPVPPAPAAPEQGSAPTPPSGYENMGPPAGYENMAPPSGYENMGPPCSSPEECAKMFGPQQ